MDKRISKRKEIIEFVNSYVAEYGITTLRAIVDFVDANGGVRPSTATIAEILRELGYSPTTRRVWESENESA